MLYLPTDILRRELARAALHVAIVVGRVLFLFAVGFAAGRSCS